MSGESGHLDDCREADEEDVDDVDVEEKSSVVLLSSLVV